MIPMVPALAAEGSIIITLVLSRDWSTSMHSLILPSSSTLGRTRLVLTLVALLAMARVASATQITSTFDTDLDGWTSSSGGSMTFVTTGGNPGGFLRDLDLDNTDMFVSAP